MFLFQKISYLGLLSNRQKIGQIVCEKDLDQLQNPTKIFTWNKKVKLYNILWKKNHRFRIQDS